MSKKKKTVKEPSFIFNTERVFRIDETPMYGAGPTENVSEGLRRAFRAATDGKRFAAAEVDFSSISAADISVERLLNDMQIMSNFAEENPSQFESLLANLHNIQKTNELLQDTGLKKLIRGGDLITGAAMLARLVSSLLGTLHKTETEVPLFVNMTEYFPVKEIQGMCSAAQESIYIKEEVGIASGLLITPDMLSVFPPCPMVTAKDFSILVDKIKQFPCEIEEMLQNFQNPAKIRELAARIGMTEEDFIKLGGGIGCGGLVLIVIVVSVICVCIVFC